MKFKILSNLKFASPALAPAVLKYIAKAPIPAPPTTSPVKIKWISLQPAIIIITNVIALITIPTLKWFCIKKAIPTGGTKYKSGLINPFLKLLNSSL